MRSHRGPSVQAHSTSEASNLKRCYECRRMKDLDPGWWTYSWFSFHSTNANDLHLLSELNVWIRLLEVQRVLATWLVLWVSLVNLSVWAHFFLLLHGGALR